MGFCLWMFLQICCVCFPLGIFFYFYLFAFMPVKKKSACLDRKGVKNRKTLKKNLTNHCSKRHPKKSIKRPTDVLKKEI